MVKDYEKTFKRFTVIAILVGLVTLIGGMFIIENIVQKINEPVYYNEIVAEEEE